MANSAYDLDSCRYLDLLNTFRKTMDIGDLSQEQAETMAMRQLKRAYSTNDDCYRRRWTPVVLEDLLLRMKQVESAYKVHIECLLLHLLATHCPYDVEVILANIDRSR